LAIFLASMMGAPLSSAWAAPFDISDAWFRALPGALPAGGYFTAQNNTGREVSITGVSSDACGMLMMHRSSSKGGMSGMDMVDSVKVPAGGVVKFAPGGYHLMCEQPRMKPGGKVAVLLRLSNGSTVAVGFRVKTASGK
jgi:hypothetical protein